MFTLGVLLSNCKMHTFIILLPLIISSSMAQEDSEDNFLSFQELILPIHHGNILFYAPFSLRSITIKLTPLMEELAERGHKVTAVMPHLANYEHKNITVVNIEEEPDGPAMQMANQVQKAEHDSGINYILNGLRLRGILTEATSATNRKALENKILRKQIDKKAFDVVIVYTSLPNEVGVYLAQRMGAKLVLYCSAHGPNPWVQWAMGQTFHPAYQSSNGYVNKQRLSFFERVFNVIATYYLHSTYRSFTTDEIEVLLDEHFPGEERMPILDIEAKIANLAFYTGEHLLDGARPMAPNMQYLGTIHCKPPKPLPKDLNHIFDESGDNGVILISFGSYMLGKNMKDSVLQELLKVFGQLNETIVWKWEKDTMEGKPDNVYLRKWNPQQDILGHPKTKLFITHAGQSSIQESLCHKKPVIAVPIGLDQEYYATQVEEIGNGRMLGYHDIEEEQFLALIRELIDNPKYTQAATEIGNAMIDQINEPLDRAVWWIEYLIRHKGEDLLRSPVHDLPTYQYYLLDVMVVLIIVALGPVFFVFTFFRRVLRYCFNSTQRRFKYLCRVAKKSK